MKCIPVLVLFLSVAFAQEPPAAPQSGPQEGGGFGGGRRTPDAEPRSYDKVITKEAQTTAGIFTVHKVKNRYFYEIPSRELGRDFLWVSQIAKTTLGVGYGGQTLGNRVVRWERRANHILLRTVVYDVMADAKQPIARAVDAANTNAILMSFPVEAWGKNEAAVIDVTRLFTSDVPEFSARQRLRARSLDASRTFLDRVTPYPMNIEIEATHTYTASADTASPFSREAPAPAPGNPFASAGMRGSSATVVLHYSMVKLPENPMMPRLYDPRVGYFSMSRTDYGKDEPRAASVRYIVRWRLEKKDPSAALSEPVKPIVYYVDPATPAKWVPYIKQGIEDWKPAFEAAGFKNAIMAKDAPKDDPNWAAEDARYSVVRWLPSTIENASGPNVHDPRTGEILESDIQMYHNVLQLVQDWYFIQVSPLDRRAQKLPLPEDLQGALLRQVVAHEVGHTLGFQHNMKASSLYPFEKVRDREFVAKMGHTPTLMDYSRFNYVAQPEDKIEMKDLIPKIGPYDLWATKWGYQPIGGARTPDDEKKTLNAWAREQDEKPYLRFSTADCRSCDPGDQTEAVGDADAVTATALGVKNISRIMGYVLDTATKEGEDWEELDRLYARILGQWAREMGHVTSIVGGFDSAQRHGGQQGVRFWPVSKERQVGAVKFLNENAFATPTLFLKPEILRRIEPNGVVERMRTAQSGVLGSLLQGSRMQRMVEQEAMDGVKAYKPSEFLGDLRNGIFKEMYGAGAVSIDAFRRNLQRVYLEMLAEKLNGSQRVTDDQRALFRAELKKIGAQAGAVAGRATNDSTRAHLDDVKDVVAKILDPKIQWTAPQSATGVFVRRGFEGMDCWQDYGIY